MKDTFIEEIEIILTQALKNTLSDLKKDFPNHHFYYFSLTTTGEALTPGHSVWSEELLEEEAKRQAEKGNDNWEVIKENIRYSYADSPLFYYYGKYFDEVEKLFLKRPDICSLSEEDWEKEFNLRINSMIKSLQNVDDLGYFGVGKEREKWFINVEVNPPDGTNLSRAKRFNSEKQLQKWIDWGGE